MCTTIFKFRTANHYLPVEIGLWNNILLEDRDVHCVINLIVVTSFIIHNSRIQFLYPYYYIRLNTYGFKELLK